jgi:hypothetical protein
MWRGASGALAVAALLVFGSCMTSGVSAVANARVRNPTNVVAMTALYAPSALTATTSGHDVALSWNAGQNGSGYKVLGVNNGSSTNCSGVTYASVGTPSATSYADTGRSTPQGTWFCYQVQTSYGTAWTSVQSDPSVAAQIGFVASSVVLANGGTPNKLDPGDTIVLTFNQAMNTTTGPSGTNTVCSINGNTIMLGATATSGACSSSETVNLGTLTVGSSNKNGRWNASWTWSNANKTLTVTIGTLTVGTAPTTSGTWTFNPVSTTSKLLSSAGAFHVCDTNTGGGLCLAAATGSF